MSGSCCDFGEAYTGAHDWNDYTYKVTLIPQLGDHHRINFRVQGAVRSYAVGLAPDNKLVLYKNENGYRALAENSFPWAHGKEYTLIVEIKVANIKVLSCGEEVISFTDKESPFLTGQVGMSVFAGSHCHYRSIGIESV